MRCPECKSNSVIKKGKRKTRYGSKQRYLCKDCRRRVTDNALKNKICLPRIIYTTLNYYDLGFSFRDASKQVNKKFRVKTSKSTVHCWINEFQDLCPISSSGNDFSNYQYFGM